MDRNNETTVHHNGALVLMSGGQDSATCLFWALKQFQTVHAITFRYGQKHEIETIAAHKICDIAGVQLKEVDISFIKDIVVSNLFQGEGAVDVPHSIHCNLPASYVPYRNLLFLTVAAGWASTLDVHNIVTGVCEADYSGYPDCRDVFIRSAETTLNLAGGTDYVRLHTPLMTLTKADEFALAEELGCLDTIITQTLTCYNAVETMHAYGKGCGECPSCRLRKKGYEDYIQRKGGR